MTQLGFREVHPYFQVLAFECTDAHAYTPDELVQHLNTYVDDRVELRGRAIVLDEVPALEGHEALSLLHVTHRFVPTWIRGTLEHQLTNTENDLVILFRTNGYLFVHTSCEAVGNAINDFLSSRLHMISQQKLVSLAALPQITFRAIGMNNLFMPGGTAPESKAYYSRNTRYVLTSALDGAFGFIYGMGALAVDDGGRPRPIGVSPRKGKVWGGWSADVLVFVEDCRALRILLDQVDPNAGFEVLAHPASGDFSTAVPILFHADYYDQKAGLVLMSRDRKGNFSGDWVCHLTGEATAEGNYVVAVRIGDETQPAVNLDLHREDDGTWAVRYQNPESRVWVVLADDEDDVKGRHRRDLVDYLMDKQNFTILLDQGVAYRESVYYRDNRFTPRFVRAEADTLSWTGVDIRREEKPPRNEHPAKFSKNIAEAIEEKLRGSHFGVHVNGAGEVADFVVVEDAARRRFILVHAKYSEDDEPGLRVGDLHEVCSQAVKNLKYLVSTYLAPETDSWHSKQFTAQVMDENTCKSTVDSLLHELPSMDREVWIVQPGISKAKLEAAEDNKIHSLLNYVDACCRINNATFRFICSP